jgi:KDO2-lipid IV(A) lauroyltransferase
VSRLREWRYRLEAGAARVVLWLASTLPIGAVDAMANGAGWVAYLVWAERRRIAIENLLAAGMVPDEPAARRLARECFQSFCLMIAESVVARQAMTPENWRDIVTFHGPPEALTIIQNPRRGFLLVSAHIGNWETAVRAASMIRPVVAVHRPLSNPHLQELTYGGRTGSNLRVVSSLERDPFRFLDALARGEMLGVMIDQHAGDQRVRVDFFGRPAWTTKSVAMLHLLTRVPLVCGFSIRTGPLRYDVQVSGPFEFQRSGDRERDALEITQALTREVEKIARQFPAQYMWGHRRWKP